MRYLVNPKLALTKAGTKELVNKTMPTSIDLIQKIQRGHNQEVFNKYEKLGEEIT